MKMDNFVRLSKINSTTLKILLFSSFLFFYFKAIFKPFSKTFKITLEFWINTTHHDKLYAPTCMNNQLLNLMMNFKLMKIIIFLCFMSRKILN